MSPTNPKKKHSRMCQSLVALSLVTFVCNAGAPLYVSPQVSPTAASPRRVILDADPGIDDAIAILLAVRSPELKVEAVTIVAGNVTVDQGSENALRVLSLARRADIPVARGSERPLRKTLVTATHWHGPNGLGGWSCHARAQSLIVGTRWI